MAETPHQVQADELLARARACIGHAYAQYSRFPVAAAVLASPPVRRSPDQGLKIVPRGRPGV